MTITTTATAKRAPHSGMDYGDWVLNWWWPAALTKLSENTRANYRSTLNIYVLPYFESVALDEITRTGIRQWIASMHDDGVRVSTADSAIRVFRTTMMAAMVKGLIPSNPLVGVRAS
jgi:site-specific recombinase XerD